MGGHVSVKIKGLVVLTVLYSFSLLVQSVSAQSRKSRVNSAGVSNRFTLLGTYSDMRFTQEHAYGSQVDLWRQGKELVGHFLHSEGLSGDTPTGLMEKVSYDPNSRRLSFEARLTLGKHYCRTHHGLPSRDKFIFDGTLNKGSIMGSLQREDGFHPESPGMRKEVRLRKRVSPGLNDFESRQQWEQYSKDILRYRGPRW
jgi:hypothetical protein